jgi:hypothetical protein
MAEQDPTRYRDWYIEPCDGGFRFWSPAMEAAIALPMREMIAATSLTAMPTIQNGRAKTIGAAHERIDQLIEGVPWSQGGEIRGG